MNRSLAKLLLVLLWLAVGPGIQAQPEEADGSFFSISNLQSDLRDLRLKRDLVRQLIKTSQEKLKAAELELAAIIEATPGRVKRLKGLEAAIMSEGSFADFVARTEDKIDTLEPLAAENPSSADELQNLRKRLQQVTDVRTAQIAERDTLEQQLEDTETQKADLERAMAVAQEIIATNEQELSTTDAKVEVLLGQLDEQSDFRFWITITFIILVGLVIGWVALITIKHADVRQTVFAGDKGLQFVTLFALIIAIILFGIVGILSGRELSALLGGISGFILGRAGQSNSADQQPATPASD